MSIEDRAQEHEAHIWEINNMRRKVGPPPAKPGDADYGPEECEECGDTMHPVRRSYRFILCTSCQTAREIVTRRR